METDIHDSVLQIDGVNVYDAKEFEKGKV